MSLCAEAMNHMYNYFVEKILTKGQIRNKMGAEKGVI